jgi:DNA repair protein RecN (Recombination protein N)
VIEEIQIRDLGVINEARLEFRSGLNVLSGETGAGKTMVLTALGLLLGNRADSSAVRANAQAAFVEGRWLLKTNAELTDRVHDAGGVIEDGELILNRSISTDGRSRASVGGSSAPVGVLAELGENLVVVHGQADQIRLKSAVAQREALDAFCGDMLQTLLTEYGRAYNSWRELERQLTALRSNLGGKAQELDDLRIALADIQAVSPQPDEDTVLAETAAKLTHAEDIRLAVSAAHEALSSEAYEASDAIDALGSARRSLEHVSMHDGKLAELVEALRLIGSQVTDVAAELSGYLASIESNTALELEQVQERRSAINVLIKRYGPTLQDVFDLERKAKFELENIDISDEGIRSLEANVVSARAEAASLADQLSALRSEGATALASAVTEELHGLAMAGASLLVTVVNTGELGLHGQDEISINLSAYPGAAPRPLGKGASGGELSRIMLAIEVVLAKGKTTPTFVFDEVDAGVGGAAAIEVGKRLARLSKQTQVIVVTHLAQVAAFADNHLRVEKASDSTFTASSVRRVEGDERVAELARMLSGLGDSENARTHAAELVELSKTL